MPKSLNSWSSTSSVRMRRETIRLLAPEPSEEQLARYFGMVDAKDVHVLVAALSVRADYLRTLDRPLARELAQAKLPVRRISLGKSITDVLPGNAETSLLRG